MLRLPTPALWRAADAGLAADVMPSPAACFKKLRRDGRTPLPAAMGD
jgi:hypothetical protein